MTSMHWRFRKGNPDGGRDFGNANVWAFDPTLDVFTREVCQNVLDVREGPTVHVDFGLYRLTGDALAAFQDGIAWHELEPHLRASADESQKFGRELKQGLDHLDDEHELIVLRIEETNARGLVGDETGTNSNFAALCRNNLDSNKSSTAGGAFGLGKAVLWRCSSLSTVLFHSDLVEPLGGDPDRQSGRLFGRCELAWHAWDDLDYAGPGWFGALDENDHDQVVSAWNAGDAARSLLARPAGSTGTSILVVGFQDPSQEGQETVEDMAQDLAAALALHFWPAIQDGQLAPTVGYWADGPDGPRTEVPVDLEATMKPFVRIADAFDAEDLKPDLAEVGNVTYREVRLQVPARLDGSHPQATHQADLLVRRADADLDQELVSTVATVRGTGMVVEYWRLPSLRIGARPFHAVLRCGQASSANDAREEAEEFLRAAEPPSHDRWTLTPDVKASYHQGGGARLNDLKDEVRSLLRELVAPLAADTEDGPEALKRLLAIKAPPERTGEPHVTKLDGEVVDGTWRLRITVTAKPRDGYRWRFAPVARAAVEAGAAPRLDIAEWSAPKNCTFEDEVIAMMPGKRQCSFTVTLDPDSMPGEPDDLAIDLALKDRLTEPVT
ncbi:MAG TPA: hypothetical protein VFY45_17125 [Baekduia sp.]|nr:hypothetical protein [Baekduia sp.]